MAVKKAFVFGLQERVFWSVVTIKERGKDVDNANTQMQRINRDTNFLFNTLLLLPFSMDMVRMHEM